MLLDLYANHQEQGINAEEAWRECFCLLQKTEELTNCSLAWEIPSRGSQADVEPAGKGSCEGGFVGSAWKMCIFNSERSGSEPRRSLYCLCLCKVFIQL